MRQVFGSQRVETVEGVAALLRAAGIEVHVSNGRSYHGRRSGQFSYLDPVDPRTQPAVWVVHADDQARARQILREHHLIETTRPGQPGLQQAYATPTGTSTSGLSWARRIRIVLLLVVAVVGVLVVIGHRAARQTPPVSVSQPASMPAAPAGDDDARVRIQPLPAERPSPP